MVPAKRGIRPMQVRVRHGKNKQSEAFARFHRVVCDQPFDEGGGDTGMTPPELMLAALGCCAMHYASEYLKARHLAPAEVELPVTGEKGGRPARLTEIAIEVDAPAPSLAGLLQLVSPWRSAHLADPSACSGGGTFPRL